MNKLLTTLALALCVGAAPALAEKTVNTKAGIPVRVGVPCKFALYGMIKQGKCSIATLGPETMYQFSDGTSRYTVWRDPDDESAAVLFQTHGKNRIRIASVQALGECWMGDGVLLCAK